MADRECGKAVAIEVGGCVTPLNLVDAPAAEPLTELQHRFIEAFLANGGKGEAAAIEAGYGGGAANMATRNLAKPKVQDELIRRVKLQSGAALAIALGGLLRIIEHSEDDKAVVAASIGLLDRFGMAPPRGPAVAIQVNNIGKQATTIIAEVVQRRLARLAKRRQSAIAGDSGPE